MKVIDYENDEKNSKWVVEFSSCDYSNCSMPYTALASLLAYVHASDEKNTSWME